VTHSVRERARERWAKPADPADAAAERKRSEMLRNFEKFCKEHGLDAGSAEVSHEPKLAHAVHDFVHNVVRHRAEQIEAKRQTEPAAAPAKLAIVPYDPVRQRIDRHYARFGAGRRYKSQERRLPEEAVLSRHKRPIFAKVYVSRSEAAPDAEEQTLPSTIPRYVQYPEIGVAMQLRDICFEKGYDRAADGAEITLASYGERFLDLANYSDLVVQGDVGTRRVQREFDIPKEFQAEDPDSYQPRRPTP
jgi:hypothetical protein